MCETNNLIDNLSLCLLHSNMPIQLLTSVSLFFYSKNTKNNFGLDSELINQIEISISENKYKREILTQRIFPVLSNIKILFFKFNLNFKTDSCHLRKRKYENSINMQSDSLEKCLHLTVNSENHLSLNLKQTQILELLSEIKKGFLLVDLTGFLTIKEEVKDYIINITEMEMEMEKLSFHIFRKLKSFKNIMMIKNYYNDDKKMEYIFKDKLIKKNNFSEFILFFSEGIYSVIINWIKWLDSNFFLWIKNVFLYKLNLYRIFSDPSFQKIDRRCYFETIDDSSSSILSFIPKLKLGKFGGILEFSIEDINFYEFITYGESISFFFENLGRVNKIMFETENKNFVKKQSSSETNHINFDILGFIFFQETIHGLLQLKKKLMNIEKKQIFFGFENKIIFSVSLIGSDSYSEKIINFFIRKFRKRDLVVFLKTGNHMLFKNFSFLLLGISIVFPPVMKKLLAKKMNKLQDFLLRVIFVLFSEKPKKKYFFQSNLKKNFFIESKKKLFILSLISIFTIQTFSSKIFCMKFLVQSIKTIKNINNNSILNREYDSLLRFLPLIFGIQVFGNKHNLRSYKFKFQITNNKNFQYIWVKILQYCAYIGSGKKELIKIAIKEMRHLEVLKTRKSERNFIIQERCRKKSLLSAFTSIYDLNISRELNRSFIYFKFRLESSILGLCLLVLGDIYMSKMVFRLHSFFLVSESVENTSFAILSISFLFLSNNECPAIDVITKLSGNKDFSIAKNSIFALGLIGAGTNNTRIKNALKCLANFYKVKLENKHFKKKFLNEEDNFQFFRKLKSLLFLIRISQGMVNSFYYNLSYINTSRGRMENSKIGNILLAIFSFMDSNFVGLESILVCFFLLTKSFNSKLHCTFDNELKIKSLKITNPLIKKFTQKYVFTPCFLEA